MIFGEDFVLKLAGETPPEQGAANKLAADMLHASEAATFDGLKVEVGIATASLQPWQAKIRPTPPDIDGVLQKLSQGSPKVSLAPAAQMYINHEAEQKVVREVLKLKERAVAAARQAVERGELAVMRADLEAQKADAILIAIRHLEVEKMVHSADPGIELPVGDLLRGAIDRIVETELQIRKRESK